MLAVKMGIPEKNIFIADIGQVLETNNVSMKFAGTVPAGRILVDGLGVGDVGSVVLRDRKHLAEDGLIIVAAAVKKSGAIVSGPDIVSRGFVYVKESEKLMDDAKAIARKTLEEQLKGSSVREWGSIKPALRDALSSFIYQQTKRSPMILPVIMEV